ncbi:MAG TPA: 4-hydroxybenzoate octaprenyltransferase [Phycisphaerae bacterium]|nr:putative 4-hydroxybenzoate polyprenyltransferase [Phycisphaerales bacterium]HNO78231.1 4-hydroxybenzoate octaprenyltransferase [Phycisphaerae bacterium]
MNAPSDQSPISASSPASESADFGPAKRGAIESIRVWTDMIKFAHSVFALPFAIMATFLAGRSLPGQRPSWLHLVLIVVCMVAARSVAMTFNRIVDARIDARNPRTATRPLPAGKLTMLQAWVFLAIFFVTYAIGCFGFYIKFDNPWPMLLGGPVLMMLCGYSFAKRFTRWSHFWLGCAIGLSPLAAWIAIHPATLGWPAVLLWVTVMLWMAGFDIIYACQDIDVDRKEGLFSLPSKIGPGAALMITRVAHVLVVGLLVLVGKLSGLGWVYFVGVGIVAVLLLIENLSVRPDDFSKVNLAFFTINGIVSLLLATCTVIDVLMNMPPVL